MAGIFIGKKIVEQKVCARIFLSISVDFCLIKITKVSGCTVQRRDFFFSIPVFVGGVSNIIGACGGGEAR